VDSGLSGTFRTFRDIPGFPRLSGLSAAFRAFRRFPAFPTDSGRSLHTRDMIKLKNPDHNQATCPGFRAGRYFYAERRIFIEPLLCSIPSGSCAAPPAAQEAPAIKKEDNPMFKLSTAKLKSAAGSAGSGAGA